MSPKKTTPKKVPLPSPPTLQNRNLLNASQATGLIMQRSPGHEGRRLCADPDPVRRSLQGPRGQREPGTYTQSLLTEPASSFSTSGPGPVEPGSRSGSPVGPQTISWSLQQAASTTNRSCHQDTAVRPTFSPSGQQPPWRRITKPRTLHNVSLLSRKSWTSL